MKSTSKNVLDKLFQQANVSINGDSPWDIQIHDERFYDRVLSEGSLGLGESYMEGWWDCHHIDQFIDRILRANLQNASIPKFKYAWEWLKATLFNLQSKNRAFIVGQKHYDLGNDLFQLMLDKRMSYSCAYWKNANNLDEVQEAKLDIICQRLYLQPGMKVLDIGCGWGSFSQYAAEKYGVKVVGVTVSQQQLELAKIRCQGLPVELRLQDYRDVHEKFDRIVSIGQLEHVGYKNYPDFMALNRQNINDDGLLFIGTIGSNVSYRSGDPWLEKYIFPNGQLPSIKQLADASENHFVMEDWQNIGCYYDKTLMAWYDNFIRNWDKIKDNYDEQFKRMWTYYLLSCAGTFRARNIQLWHIVFSPHGVTGGYKGIR